MTLYTFALTGGIEKVCRAVAKAFGRLETEGVIKKYQVQSMYDDLADSKYIAPTRFKGFGGKKIAFTLSALKGAWQADILILSHVHLLLFGWLIKRLDPKRRIILFAHGIEIWKPLSKWKRKFLQQEAEIWAVSNYTLDKIIEQHQIGKEHIHILNNCLDPLFVVPNQFEKPAYLLDRYAVKDQKILFSLCRLAQDEKYKGYDLVLEALKHLPVDVHYIIGGKADDQEYRRISNLIESNDLNGRVTLAGFIHEEEITAHYLLADIFVMPSKGEGFGISFIEAAACGCKIIAGNQDGSCDALLQGGLGKLVDPNDTSSLKLAIEALLSDKSWQGNEQQQKATSRFGFDFYPDKIRNLLIPQCYL